MQTPSLPGDFIWRRLHSLAGLGLALYLMFHLLTNSRSASFLGDSGLGFVEDVNWIHSLPYLPLLEVMLLGFPILVHAAWGIRYLFTGESNAFKNDGKSPYLPYSRNKAYSWQRLSAWILLIALSAHIVHMRFMEYPAISHKEGKTWYTVEVQRDPALESLNETFHFELSSGEKGQALVTADNFGTTALVMVRDTFKSPLMRMLYTLFVLTACFHAFNGLWTFMIKWGVTLTERSQRVWLRVCQGIMAVVALLGLIAIFG